MELGIDRLEQENFAPLQGRRVGLITNQTGVDSRGLKTRLILMRARGVRLAALFTPEHGLDGTETAGKYVATRRDPLTGLTAYSLYGPTRKPDPRMLEGIDMLVYDMQDIGCRSYTYVSTLVKCMEAAGEKGIPLMVLDRPNPLGGNRLEGPPIEPQWISFVGQLPVPYIHGMTVGELARMANGMGWAGPRCALTIVEMRGWRREMTWADTGLRWVPTSPNIPRSTSPAYYVVTGMIGELAGLETGVGSAEPFEIIGAKWLDARRFTSALRALHLSGVTFSEYARGGFQGSRLQIEPHTDADLCSLATYILALVNSEARPDLFARSPTKLEMFYKVYGSRSIRSALEQQEPVARIVGSWGPSLSRFASQRTSYLLYP